MARMPGTEWVGPHHDNGVMSRYDVVCVHTIVGYAPAHAAHFSTNSAGTIYQSRDTTYRSAANLNGNWRVIAIENEDHGPTFKAWSGSSVPGFTAQQIEAIARICVWANKAHGVPLVQCPDSKPGSRGIAFHRQGIQGNFANGWIPGGELWSSSTGKVCPGDQRISQMPQIITRARQLAGLEEDEDMNTAQDAALGALWQALVSPNGEAWKGSNLEKQLGYVLTELRAGQAAIAAAIASDDLDPEALSARLEAAAREAAAAGAEQAIVTTVLPALREVLAEALGEDNKAQAAAIVDRLAERLRPVSAAPEGN